MPPIIDNGSYTHPSFVHVYPNHRYLQPSYAQSGKIIDFKLFRFCFYCISIIVSAPPIMIPSNDPTSIQYAMNQLAALSLQSQNDNSRVLQSNYLRKPFVQSSTHRLICMSNHHQFRSNCSLMANTADKQSTLIENNIISTINNNSEQISLSNATQEKDCLN